MLLRKHLAEYYAGPGKEDPIRIAILRGGYLVQVSPKQECAQQPPETPSSGSAGGLDALRRRYCRWDGRDSARGKPGQSPSFELFGPACLVILRPKLRGHNDCGRRSVPS